MTHDTDLVDASGWLKEPHTLPLFDALESAATAARALYDALERMTREAKDGCVSVEAILHADEVLTSARMEVK